MILCRVLFCQQQILEENTPFDDKPLYMYLSHQAVHPPLGLPPAGCFSAEEVAILEKVKTNSNEDGHLRHRFAQVMRPRFMPKSLFNQQGTNLRCFGCFSLEATFLVANEIFPY